MILVSFQLLRIFLLPVLFFFFISPLGDSCRMQYEQTNIIILKGWFAWWWRLLFFIIGSICHMFLYTVWKFCFWSKNILNCYSQLLKTTNNSKSKFNDFFRNLHTNCKWPNIPYWYPAGGNASNNTRNTQ